MELIERDAAKSEKVYCTERHEYVVPVAELDWLPTIDPIRAAGGCYCRECRRCDGFPNLDIEHGEVGICKATGLMVHADDWCKWSKLREAQDDG